MKIKKNKKVLILGGSSDIGLGIIKTYLKNNYEIIAHYNQTNKSLKKIVKTKIVIVTIINEVVAVEVIITTAAMLIIKTGLGLMMMGKIRKIPNKR